MANKPKAPTFKDMVTEPTWSEGEHPTEGAYAVRVGRYNLSEEFFDLHGDVLRLTTDEVTPRQAKMLVLQGAAVAHEGCGCGGWRGCAPGWATADELSVLKAEPPPKFADGTAPTWIDVWKSAGATVVFTHGDVEWGDVGLCGAMGEVPMTTRTSGPHDPGNSRMKVTVIGGQGAWPTADAGCSGYLVEAAGQRILVDPGWATFQGLIRLADPGEIDAVLVSHSHPDHCADLLPLLRARALSEPAADPLPVYAPAGALDHLLASDAVGAVQRSADLRVVADGSSLQIGPFDVTFAELPHHVTNLGMRLSAQGATVSYTGDGGPDAAVVELAADADLHIAEATFAEPITGEDAGLLTDLATAIEQGVAAGAREVLLTHLWPGTSYDAILRSRYSGNGLTVRVAHPGLTWE